MCMRMHTMSVSAACVPHNQHDYPRFLSTPVMAKVVIVFYDLLRNAVNGKGHKCSRLQQCLLYPVICHRAMMPLNELAFTAHPTLPSLTVPTLSELIDFF